MRLSMRPLVDADHFVDQPAIDLRGLYHPEESEKAYEEYEKRVHDQLSQTTATYHAGEVPSHISASEELNRCFSAKRNFSS